MRTPRILIVDDEEGMREVIGDTLQRLGSVELRDTGDPLAAVELLAQESFDVLISDIRMPGMTGVELLRKAREHDPHLPVLMLTGFPSVDSAVECLKLGAVDYITKPFLPDELLANVGRFLEERRLREENRLLERRVQRYPRGFEDIVGNSQAMQKVFDIIDRVADTDVDVLIQGDTGTGKELVARALHSRSRRKGKRFVPVDCGAIPETLMESELFGHERGAFTGANARSIGLLEFADEGTFFMDEVGELPMLLQAKLLRALQERKIRRVGGKAELAVDVRVVAATGRDLDKSVEEERFRQDLLFRINVVTIQLPPLRERGDDVRLLAQHFVASLASDMGKAQVTGFSAEALEVLQLYRWPGNVRELQNVVRRGIAMTRGETIEVDDLPDHLVATSGELPSPRSEREGFFDLRARRMAAFEKEYLGSLLNDHDGDVAAAAKTAQIPRGTYYRLLKNHNLKASDFR
jgi:DNA-binding NtrC family response regulator